MQGKNLRYLNDHQGQEVRKARAGFVLLEHFSLPAFTQALDTIVTANLIRPESFATQTFGLAFDEVVSDLGLVIRPDSRLSLDAVSQVGRAGDPQR